MTHVILSIKGESERFPLFFEEAHLALHGLATIGMALAADVNLCNVTLVALAAVAGVAMDGVMGIVGSQLGGLLCQCFPATAMAAQPPR